MLGFFFPPTNRKSLVRINDLLDKKINQHISRSVTKHYVEYKGGAGVRAIATGKG